MEVYANGVPKGTLVSSAGGWVKQVPRGSRAEFRRMVEPWKSRPNPQRTITRARQPKRYYQIARERRRDQSIRLAHLLGGISRHEEDRKGSRTWIETGIWPRGGDE